MISGAPGAGKTVLASQIAYSNATSDEKALIITTLSEPMSKLIRFAQEFTFFDMDKIGSAVIYEDIGTRLIEEDGDKTIDFILDLVQKYDPSLLIIDSFKALSDLTASREKFRRSVYRLIGFLSAIDCTTFLVGEYEHDDLHKSPEFSIVDGILELSNRFIGLRSYRSLRVIKMRGSDFIPGEHAFKITHRGITVFPRFVTPPEPLIYEVSSEKCPTGIVGLDELFSGGFPKGTATLVAGEPGAGKTVTALHFLLNGARMGDKGLYISFQEDPNQLRKIAFNFGYDLSQFERQGTLKMLYVSPVELDIDEHILEIIDGVERLGADRVVVDSVGDLEAGAARDHDRFFNYIYSMVQYFKNNVITSMLTAEMSEIFGSGLIMTGRGISHIADNIILLRYVEMESRVKRVLTVLKSRGSYHSNEIREYLISEEGGIRIGDLVPSTRYVFSNLALSDPGNDRGDRDEGSMA
jgi:circadian clock protein KaiC